MRALFDSMTTMCLPDFKRKAVMHRYRDLFAVGVMAMVCAVGRSGRTGERWLGAATGLWLTRQTRHSVSGSCSLHGTHAAQHQPHRT